MVGDVAAFVKYGFSSWKLDGCGGEWNLVEFNKHMNSTGKAVMVENCHWGIVVRVVVDTGFVVAAACARFFPWALLDRIH